MQSCVFKCVKGSQAALSGRQRLRGLGRGIRGGGVAFKLERGGRANSHTEQMQRPQFELPCLFGTQEPSFKDAVLGFRELTQRELQLFPGYRWVRAAIMQRLVVVMPMRPRERESATSLQSDASLSVCPSVSQSRLVQHGPHGGG